MIKTLLYPIPKLKRLSAKALTHSKELDVNSVKIDRFCVKELCI